MVSWVISPCLSGLIGIFIYKVSSRWRPRLEYRSHSDRPKQYDAFQGCMCALQATELLTLQTKHPAKNALLLLPWLYFLTTLVIRTCPISSEQVLSSAFDITSDRRLLVATGELPVMGHADAMRSMTCAVAPASVPIHPSNSPSSYLSRRSRLHISS